MIPLCNNTQHGNVNMRATDWRCHNLLFHLMACLSYLLYMNLWSFPKDDPLSYLKSQQPPKCRRERSFIKYLNLI